jgi:pSer/pThr/pTyr-binding forkhead associated (FHA) protein
MTAGRLYWVQRDGAVSEIPMTKERLTVGRSSDCDVRLAVPSVSSRHATILRTDTSVTVEDLGSTNGTKVNGRKVDTLRLKHGDQIEFGTERLVFFTDSTLPAGEFNRLTKVAKPKSVELTPPEGEIRPAKPILANLKTNEPPTQISQGDGSSQRAATVPIRGSVTILSGRMAGKKFPLTKETTTLGQEGLQVFQIVLREGAYWAVRGPSSTAPTVNGHDAGDRGLRLAHNDVVELAGASVRFEIDPY